MSTLRSDAHTSQPVRRVPLILAWQGKCALVTGAAGRERQGDRESLARLGAAVPSGPPTSRA